MPYEIDSVSVRSVQEIGAMIRDRRKSLGFTQVRTSGLAGVGTRFLLELENGKPTIEIGKALQILDLLGLDVWLVPRERGELG